MCVTPSVDAGDGLDEEPQHRVQGRLHRRRIDPAHRATGESHPIHSVPTSVSLLVLMPRILRPPPAYLRACHTYSLVCAAGLLCLPGSPGLPGMRGLLSAWPVWPAWPAWPSWLA